MKRLIIISIFLISVLNIYSQDSTNQSIQLSGQFLTDQRILLQNGNDWIWNENRLNIELSKKYNNVKFFGQIWFKNIGLPEFYSMSSLYNKGITDPVDFEIREAYTKVSGFIFKNLDFTIGRQIITWGTADKINPTDNLNPNDFEDLMDFGRKRGTDAISFDYYFGSNFSLQGVFVPFFRPSNLPLGVYSDVFVQTFELPQGLNLAGFSDSLFLPEKNLKENMTIGAKFKGFVAGIDFSFSYIYGRENMPMPYYLTLTPVDMMGDVNVTAKLNYPRQHIFGFDMATNIGNAGVWGEIAAFLPTEDIKLTTDLSALYPLSLVPVLVDSTIISSDKPYLKYVIGADYFLPLDFYLNIQYIHGFLHERGNNEMNDYYFLKLDKSLFYEKLKIAPVAGAFIISDYSDIKNNYAFVYMPEIIYKPYDSFEISLSATLIDGKGNSLFTKLNDFDMFILKVKYNF